MHAFSSFFFPFKDFPQFKGDKLYTKVMHTHTKKIDHHICSKVKDHCTSSHGPWIEKQYCVLQMQPCSFNLIAIMRNIECAVQNQGITLI